MLTIFYVIWEKYEFGNHPEATYTYEASVSSAITLLWRLVEWTRVQYLAASRVTNIFKEKREVSLFSNQQEFKDGESDFKDTAIV